MAFPIIRTIISLWLAHFLVDFMIGVWAIYKTLTHLDLFLAGAISGLGAFLGEGMQIIFGPLSDKGYRKHLICLGLFVTAASSFLAYTSDYTAMFLLFTATCLGSGAFHPSAVSLAGALTPNRKALMITIFASGGALGLAFSQLVFAKVYLITGGQTAYLMIPTAALALGLVFYGLQNIQQFTPVLNKQHHTVKALFNLFKDRDLRLLYIAQVSNQSIFWGAIFLLPDALVCKGYDDWMCHGGAHLFLILGGAVMMVPSGYLADRFNPKTVLFWTTMGSMLSFYCFLYSSLMPRELALLVIFLLGAFTSVINPMIIAFGNKLAPSTPGMVSAFLMGMAWCLSEGLGQGGGGLLTKFFDEHAPVYALAILGTFYISGLISTLLLPSRANIQKRFA